MTESDNPDPHRASATEPPPRPPIRRRWLIWGALAVGLVGVLIAAGVFPQEPLRRLAETQLTRALGGACRIGDLHLVPGRLRLEARAVHLESAAFVLDLPHVLVDLGGATLLGRQLSVDAVDLEAPRLVIRADAPPRPATSTRPLDRPLAVNLVRITGATVVVERAGTESARLEGLEVAGAIGRGALDLTLRRGVVAGLTIDSGRARLAVAPTLDTTIEDLEVRSGSSRLHLTGRVTDLLGRPRADVQQEAQLDLAGLTRALGAEALATRGVPPALSGSLSVTGTVAGSDASDLTAHITLRGARLVIEGLPLDDLQCEVRHAGRDVRDTKGAGTRLHLEARAFGGRLLADGRRSDSGAVDGALTLDGLALERLPPSLGLAAYVGRGRVSGHLTGRGNLDRMSLAGEITADASGPELSAAQAALRLTGSVQPRLRGADLQWTLESEATGRLHPSLPVRAASVHMEGHSVGPWPPATDATLNAHAQLTGAAGPIETEIAATLRTQGARLEGEGSARTPGGRLEASATFDTARRSFERLVATVEDLDLGLLHKDAAGRLSASLEAQGPLAQLRHTSRLDASGLTWQGAALGALHATASGVGGAFHLETSVPDLHLQGQATRAAPVMRTARGRPRSEDVLDWSLDAAQTPLAPIGPLLGRPLEGELTAHVEGRVPLLRPRAAETTFLVETLRVSSDNLPLALTRPLVGRVDGEHLIVDQLALEGPGASTVVASGVLDLHEPRAFDVRLALAADLARLPHPTGWTLAGLLDADTHWTGTLKEPRAEGRVTLREVSVTGPAAPPLHAPSATIDLTGQAAEIAVPGARLGEGSLDIEGHIPFVSLGDAPLAPGQEARVDLAWKDIDLGNWLSPRGQTPEEAGQIKGALAGRARIEGRLRRLETLTATVALDETIVGTHDVSLTLLPATITLNDGRVSAKRVDVRSAAGTLEIGATADLQRRTMEVTGRGRVDLAPLAPLLGGAALSGTADIDAHADGPWADPRIAGGLRLHAGTLRARGFDQAITDVEAEVRLSGKDLTLGIDSARLGGGSVTGRGQARVNGTRLEAVDVSLTGRGVGLRYPEGLWSRDDIDLQLTGQTGAFLLAGQVNATSGLYNEDLATEKTLLAPIPRPVVAPVLRSVRLSLDLVAARPIRVRNDVARLEATGRLALRGDLETPQPFGALDVVSPGGRLYLQGRDLLIDNARMTYDGTWEPVINLNATTRVQVSSEAVKTQSAADPGAPPEPTRRYEAAISIEAHGTSTALMEAWTARLAGSLDPSLDDTLVLKDTTSSVSLDQSVLARLIVTGGGVVRSTDTGLTAASSTTADTAGFGEAARLLGEQTAAFAATRLATGALRGVGGLGLTDIQIQPELVSLEKNPGARFTFGRRLGERTNLIYSKDLGNAEASYFELEVAPGHGTTLSARRQEDGTLGYGAGQRLVLGGPHPTAPHGAEERVLITAVGFEGAGAIPEKPLHRWVKTRVGKRKTWWDVQEDADRLRRRLAREGYLTADAVATIEEGSVTFTVRPGPHYTIAVIGMDSPPSLKRALAEVMHEEEARERGTRRLLQDLYLRGHYTARVEMTIETAGAPVALPVGPASPTSPDERRLVFHVVPGPHFDAVDASFPGAKTFSTTRLLAAGGGAGVFVATPTTALSHLTDLYRAAYYLGARCGPVRVTRLGTRLAIEVPVDEGHAARIGSVTFQGARLTPDELNGAARLASGEPYGDEKLLVALARVRDLYHSRGLAHARVDPRLEPAQTDVDILFEIDEGDVVRVGAIEVRGVSGRLERRIRKRVKLRPGDLLDPRDLGRIERRVLGLAGVGAAHVSTTADNPATLVIEVGRSSWATAGYDLRHDSTNGFTAFTDGELLDLAGLATLGTSYNLGANVRELRGSLSGTAPWARGVTLSTFRTTEDLTGPAGLDLNLQRRQTGVDVQEALRLPDRWHLLLGYRFKRIAVTSLEPVRLGALELSLLRETRDNPLDPTRGRFLSLNLELSNPRLAGDESYIKGFAQSSFARSIGRHFVWAQGARLGLAHVFDNNPLLVTERFMAGGATSVRGFATNTIGPLDFLDEPAGGQAVFVFNEELRVRHRSGFGAAVFYDLGNVFDTVRDMRLSARHSVGLGLRWASPIGLLRLDFAFPLGRHPGEAGHQRIIALGQAF